VRAEFVLVDFAFRNGNYNFIGAFTVRAQYAVPTHLICRERQKVTGKVTGAARGVGCRRGFWRENTHTAYWCVSYCSVSCEVHRDV
jgi:hypothetical protein